MAVFEYRGLVSASGKQVQGVRDADNLKVLRAALRREGVLLTGAQEAKERAARGPGLSLGALFGRVNTGDVAMITRQLATLVRAGIPLVEAMTALTDQIEKLELKTVLTQVRDRLNEGISLAKSLEAHGKIFPPLYVNMVAAGEASGTLEAVLERLADFMESQARLKGKVSAALAYPVLMLIMGSVLISVMMVAVVPKVSNIFASLDRALPWYTALLIFLSNLLSSNEMLGFVLTLTTFVGVQKHLAQPLPEATRENPKPRRPVGFPLITVLCLVLLHLYLVFTVESALSYVLGAVLGAALGYTIMRLLNYIATEAGRERKDTLLLKLPLFGSLFRMLAVARFSRTLSTLLKSGVPLLKAMDIVRNVIGNARLERVVDEAASAIREGQSIAAPLKRSGAFPPIVTHMIAVGEKSGELEGMLENVAKTYDTQVETRLQALTSLLEPLMIVFMGGAVGFIAFAILMPLIQMNEFIQ